MTTAHKANDPTAEAEIRELLETRTRALAGKDAATLVAANDAAVVVFDAVAPFVHRGAETAARKQEWLAAYRTGIGHQIRDLEISADADVAFCHFLVRISGTMVDGTEVGMWVRATTCLRRRDDGWKIVHEHASVPFDAETGESVVTGDLPG
ncbi:YybH family protein [Actinopolymorpha rutila]|uniref:Ketosteroid isomerase-like protein n=1 Tax=Actinopolymorpha rutila TaxID=446787 RepID=A0A852Z4I0_9ACTN|nr:nuclear transport factor 2 family protein [Actinopolymorpha rutila]NYH87854.1 ketosteroid isomerase-like protein [Actinopolymorpha rutila]